MKIKAITGLNHKRMMTKGIDPLGCYLKTSIYGIYRYPYIRWLE